MRKSTKCVLALLISLGFCKANPVSAQVPDPNAPDILHGDRVHLQGMKWYEFATPKTFPLSVNDMKTLYNWNVQVWTDYKKQHSAPIADGLTRRQPNEAAKKPMIEERESRLRLKPLKEDLKSGDAVNALLCDLASPTLPEWFWRDARIPLPAEITIKSLVFQVAPNPGVKGLQELSKSQIALGRLEMDGKWPLYLASDKLKEERDAFQAAYQAIRDKSSAGRLGVEEVSRLDAELDKLLDKVKKVLPEGGRGARESASKFVMGLKDAAKMFDPETMDYAQEMIADTNKHQALTVGELVAFMRKYRLMFAAVDAIPGGDLVYAKLHKLMRDQKNSLGYKAVVEIPTKNDATAIQLKKLQGTWSFLFHSMNGTSSGMTTRERWIVLFDGNRYITTKLEGAFAHAGVYTVDAGKELMEYSYTPFNGKPSPKTVYGIYRWENEVMAVYFGDPLPDKFESVQGQNRQFVKFSRIVP